jgi:protein-arginine kinase activator protein McsA
MRGGMGVRKRLSEDSLRQTYRLNGVQTGSAVARCVDKYGRWEYGHQFGVIVRKTASVVMIRWVGNEEISRYSQGDARYEVDRGRWKILGVLRGNPLDPDNPLVDALTELYGQYKMSASASADDPTPPTEETEDMEKSKAATEREAAQQKLSNGGYEDRDTYTAKQVAARCGTDSKTMRKFFRSAHSTVEPVGQGGRYEFAARDLTKIKKEFDAWSKRSAGRTPINTPAKQAAQEQIRKTKKPLTDVHTEAEIAAAKDEAPDNWGEPIEREPTPEELEEQEDLELDLDDLDADDV